MKMAAWGSAAGVKAFIDMGVSSGEFEKAWPLDAYWVDTFHASLQHLETLMHRFGTNIDKNGERVKWLK